MKEPPQPTDRPTVKPMDTTPTIDQRSNHIIEFELLLKRYFAIVERVKDKGSE